MANNFAADDNCVALWKFNNGALTTDSKGGNTLSSNGTPTADTGDFQEGDASVELNVAGNDRFKITDAALDVGYPFKTGDTTKKMSICMWFKADSLPSNNSWRFLYGKLETGKAVIDISIFDDAGTPNFRLGHSGGSALQKIDYTTNITTGIWYHMGLTYQDSDKSYRMRIWDDNAGALLDSDITGTATNNINIENAYVNIGALGDILEWDGHMDEVVVFNDILTQGEIDEIRGGTYAPVFSLTGTAAATSTASGETARSASLAGTVAATSAAEATIIIRLPLAGTITATSTVRGAIPRPSVVFDLQSITSMAFQRNPDAILWATLSGGVLISMTYDPLQDVVAWAEHPMGTALAESVAVIPATDEDEVWVSIKRTINSIGARYIERMKPRDWGSDNEDMFFVDSGLTYDSTPTTTVTGLDHLEGETVAILGDGAVLPSQVVSGGAITLVESVSVAQVGLPFTYKLKPMRFDQNTRQGTSKGSIKKIAEAVISFYKTLNAKYGDGTTTYKIPWRETSAEYGNPPDLVTGDKVVVADGGFSVSDPFQIEGDDPVNCSVRAIIPRLEVTGR